MRIYKHFFILIYIVGIESGMDYILQIRIQDEIILKRILQDYRDYQKRYGITLFINTICKSQFTKDIFALVMLEIAHNKSRLKY